MRHGCVCGGGGGGGGSDLVFCVLHLRCSLD